MPTDQAKIVQDDQLELQEHCNADHTAATRVDDGLVQLRAQSPMDFGT